MRSFSLDGDEWVVWSSSLCQVIGRYTMPFFERHRVAVFEKLAVVSKEFVTSLIEHAAVAIAPPPQPREQLL